MQIEYTIKFQKDGFTITELIDSGGTAAPVKPDAPVVANALAANAQESTASQSAGTSPQGGTQSSSPVGGGQSNRPKGGAPETESGSPITIVGPFIFLCGHEKQEGSDGK